MKLILKRKKMLPLTKKDLKSYQDATEYYICKKKKKNHKINEKLKTIAIILVNIETQQTVFVI